jgi:predicted transcriptional regulator
MMHPSEVMVAKLIPTIRARLAKILIDDYGMRQVDVADRLGITQATVSHYYTGCRGADPELVQLFPEIDAHVAVLAERITTGMTRPEQIRCINDLCTELMATDRFCDYHRKVADLRDCNVCFEAASA